MLNSNDTDVVVAVIGAGEMGTVNLGAMGELVLRTSKLLPPEPHIP